MRDRKREYELLFIVSPMRSSEEEISITIERAFPANHRCGWCAQQCPADITVGAS